LREKGIAIHDSRRRNRSSVGGFLALAASDYKNINFMNVIKRKATSYPRYLSSMRVRSERTAVD
jgi:hypothetical protein